MVVPFPPGAVADIVARVVADGMQARLGQPVIVENAAGADGSIGTGRVAHATPDGYTLVAGLWNTHVANSVIYALQYDVVTDFEPIALLADAPMLLIVNKAYLQVISTSSSPGSRQTPIRRYLRPPEPAVHLTC